MFPFVTCDLTGMTRPGYAICQHVLHGAPVAELREASDDEMGYACCLACARVLTSIEEMATGDFSLVCADCAEMNHFGGNVGEA